MLCKQCKIKSAAWFQSLCHDCEAKNKKKWFQEHTFIYGEKVKIFIGDEFFSEGIIVGRCIRDEYCLYDDYYEVKYEDGRIKNYHMSELKKEYSV